MELNHNKPKAAPGFATTDQDGLALFTDLYELTMLQAYFEERMTDTAVFSLFVRRLPARRNFLLACGLDTVLSFLETLHFEQQDIDYLASLGQFSDAFLAWLKTFAFSGDVYAVPEGTPIFGNEPILEVVAPLPEAQLVETFIMNQISLQTVLATKAQRVVAAAAGAAVVDFGARRMHGIDAALKATRAFYIGGVAATSNVLGARHYGVPVTGTMAHSYIQAHTSETAAFRAFSSLYPDTVLLVDTYDTLGGVQRVIELAQTLGAHFKVKAVRLDSGDLLTLSKQTRQLLDQSGLDTVEIFASGGLDEDAIAALVAAGAPINGYGVGTSMGVSSDAPALDIAYKLCEYAGKGRLKLSVNKPILPGRKQVFRLEEGGEDRQDIIARASETHPGRPLLELQMQQGRRVAAHNCSLDEARCYARTQIARLPAPVRALTGSEPYPVTISQALGEFQQQVKQQLKQQLSC